MAKVRSLKYLKKEIEKVEASIRKNAKGKAVADAKKRALNYLGKMKSMISDECDPEVPPSFSPIPPAAKVTAASTRKTAKGKSTKRK